MDVSPLDPNWGGEGATPLPLTNPCSNLLA